jgi:hypothetical protein
MTSALHWAIDRLGQSIVVAIFDDADQELDAGFVETCSPDRRRQGRRTRAKVPVNQIEAPARIRMVMLQNPAAQPSELYLYIDVGSCGALRHFPSAIMQRPTC